MRLVLDQGARGLSIYDLQGRELYVTAFSNREPASIICLSGRVCVLVESDNMLLLEVVGYPGFRFIGDLILEGAEYIKYNRTSKTWPLKRRVEYLVREYLRL